MPTCIICLDDLDAEALQAARACGFCDKLICGECTLNLTEIDEEGEPDSMNGDLRCPNCRGSLMEGDLHKRRQMVVRRAPTVSKQFAHDLVTLEDLIARSMQLCAHAQTGVEYYNVEQEVVACAIARDDHYASMLERVMNSSRRARAVRGALRKSPSDRSNVSSLCKLYVSQLTSTVGLPSETARGILSEVAEQSLTGICDFGKYEAAWAKQDEEAAGRAKRMRDEAAGADVQPTAAEVGARSLRARRR